MDRIIEAIRGRHTTKKIVDKIDSLSTSEVLQAFYFNNKSWVDKIKGQEITETFTNLFTNLVNDRVEETLALNLFDELTVIFLLLTMKQNKKALKNKLYNSVVYILTNSVKFDVYKNTPSTVRKIISKNNYTLEFLWLIPLFINEGLLDSIVNDKKVCFNYCEEAVKIVKTFTDYGEKHYEFATLNYDSNIKNTQQIYTDYINSLK